jgi:hypothetical protein
MSKAPVTDPLAKPVEAASFSRGPWHIYPTWGSQFGIGNDEELIVECNYKHNALLIAAAPDLLRELEHLVRLMEPVEQSTGFSLPGLATLNGARAAIKKARGQ